MSEITWKMIHSGTANVGSRLNGSAPHGDARRAAEEPER
jgi:hypothetical protein